MTILMKEPVLPACRLPAFGVRVVVSNLKARTALAGKFAPVMVTSVPAAPETGDSGLRDGGAVTVNAAEAVDVPPVTVMV